MVNRFPENNKNRFPKIIINRFPKNNGKKTPDHCPALLKTRP